MSSTQNPLPAERSEFVTVVSWIFICLSGLGTLVSVGQCFAFDMMMSFGPTPDVINDAEASGDIPPAAAFAIRHLRQLIEAFLLLWLIALVASIGLLKRRNWARLVFIGLMALGIIWNLASPILQLIVLRGMRSTMQIFSVIFALNVIYALAFCLLFGWIIVRLMSAKVRSEFA
jgi:hypothetical protein